jgi:(p)ppGpp synthase/HD superfamily hydrolase
MISSKQYKKLLDFAHSAYQENNISNQAYRQDGKVPYINHPLWCATLLLADTEVPWEERELGFQALILHDVLEDTSLKLPEWINPAVQKIVEEMTFTGDW